MRKLILMFMKFLVMCMWSTGNLIPLRTDLEKSMLWMLFNGSIGYSSASEVYIH